MAIQWVSWGPQELFFFTTRSGLSCQQYLWRWHQSSRWCFLVFLINLLNVWIWNYRDCRGVSWGQSMLTVSSWLDVLVIILCCQVNSPLCGAFQCVTTMGNPLYSTRG